MNRVKEWPLPKYNAIIIGAGSIGALKPDKFDGPNTENILTIAHAFHVHERINFLGVVDTDFEKAKKAALKWNVKSAIDIEQFKNYEIDIVAVCVPTEFHYEVIKDVVKKIKPKFIIGEKPFTNNIGEATEIKNLCEDNNIPVAIDYIRRYDSWHSHLRDCIKNDYVYGCRIAYNRGLWHEGCHALDLMGYFFGEFISGKILPEIKNHDYLQDGPFDLTYPAWMQFENCPNVYMIPVDGRRYSIFEIEIFTNMGKYVLKDHGLKLEYYKPEPEKIYGDYDALGDTASITQTQLKKALYYLADEAVQKLDNPVFKLSCTIGDAIQVHHIYNFLMEGIK